MAPRTALAFIVLAAALVPVAADAHTKGFASKARISNAYCILDDCAKNGVGVIGKVASPKQACQRGRTVKIMRKSAGSDDLVAESATDSNGVFEEEFSGTEGDRIYLRLPRRTLATGPGHSHKCGSDRSKTNMVD